MDWGPTALFSVLISLSLRDYSIQGKWGVGGERVRERDYISPKD